LAGRLFDVSSRVAIRLAAVRVLHFCLGDQTVVKAEAGI